MLRVFVMNFHLSLQWEKIEELSIMLFFSMNTDDSQALWKDHELKD